PFKIWSIWSLAERLPYKPVYKSFPVPKGKIAKVSAVSIIKFPIEWTVPSPPQATTTPSRYFSEKRSIKNWLDAFDVEYTKKISSLFNPAFEARSNTNAF